MPEAILDKPTSPKECAGVPRNLTETFFDKESDPKFSQSGPSLFFT